MSNAVRVVAVGASLVGASTAWGDAILWYDGRYVGGTSSHYDGVNFINGFGDNYPATAGEDMIISGGTYGFAPGSPGSGGSWDWDSRFNPSGLGPGGAFTSLRTTGTLTAGGEGAAGGFSQTFTAARTDIAITVSENSTWAFTGSALLEAFGPAISFNLTQARFDINIYGLTLGASVLDPITIDVLAGESSLNQPLNFGGILTPGDYLISWSLFASADAPAGTVMSSRATLDGTFSVTPELIPLPPGVAMGAAGLAVVGLAARRRKA